MTSARAQLVDKSESGFYHCMTRCVRRAFLCGDDEYSGVNFDHRRDWIESRLLVLSEIFAADVYAYAVMSNHYHVVLFMDVDRVRAWSGDEIARRWLTLCPPRAAVVENPDAPTEATCFDRFAEELSSDEERLDVYRDRLCDLSWLMRFLNEYVARKANREDQVRGRFWEGRFKAQALLDEGAVLACMAYVDLNPIRAGIAKTPESSDYTSVKTRIEKADFYSKPSLDPVSRSFKNEVPLQARGISNISLKAYLDLVDWTGRHIREGKTGFIPAHLQPILTRLQLSHENWLDTAQFCGHCFGVAAGRVDKLRDKAIQAGRQWLQGVGYSKRIYQCDAVA